MMNTVTKYQLIIPAIDLLLNFLLNALIDTALSNTGEVITQTAGTVSTA